MMTIWDALSPFLTARTAERLFSIAGLIAVVRWFGNWAGSMRSRYEDLAAVDRKIADRLRSENKELGQALDSIVKDLAASAEEYDSVLEGASSLAARADATLAMSRMCREKTIEAAERAIRGAIEVIDDLGQAYVKGGQGDATVFVETFCAGIEGGAPPPRGYVLKMLHHSGQLAGCAFEFFALATCLPSMPVFFLEDAIHHPERSLHDSIDRFAVWYDAYRRSRPYAPGGPSVSAPGPTSRDPGQPPV